MQIQPRLSVNSAAAAIASDERGHGMTRVLSYQVEDALAAGRLVRVLEAFEPMPVPVTLLYQANRRGAPNIAAFVAAARAYFQAAKVRSVPPGDSSAPAAPPSTHDEPFEPMPVQVGPK